MLLIVYGSFRSLNMEREARERAEREKEASLLGGKPAPAAHASSEYLAIVHLFLREILVQPA